MYFRGIETESIKIKDIEELCSTFLLSVIILMSQFADKGKLVQRREENLLLTVLAEHRTTQDLQR